MDASRSYQTSHIDFDEARRRLIIDWADGLHGEYPYIWLRHFEFFPLMGRPSQCDSNDSLLPEDPLSLSIKSVSLEPESILIEWHQCTQPSSHKLTDLRDNALPAALTRRRKQLPKPWLAMQANQFRWFDGADFEAAASLLEIYIHLRDHGIALVKNLPTTPGTILSLAEYFGPVRNTHFGSLFDIRSLPQDRLGTGNNIGGTSHNALAPHTDEGWRHGPPGISLFHCLKSDPHGGGVSRFVDGIGAAQYLRESEPDAFEFLASVPLIFYAERNPKERFRSRARVIATDVDGVVRGVRVSDRTMGRQDLAADQIEMAYSALRSFYRILLAPERSFEHRLEPGEMVIFDNHRVLHARSAFDPEAGERWLQQLSIDREEFHNRLRQLAELQQRYDLSDWEQDAGVLSQH